MRGAVVAVAWAAVLTAGLAAGCRSNGQSSEGDEAEEPQPAPAPLLFQVQSFSAVALVDGGQVTLQSLEGKVVLLDLFGTWCPPCRRSVPLLVSLYERFRGRGFQVVGLAYEREGETVNRVETLQAFRDEFQVPYLLAIGPEALWAELREKAGAEGVVPTILLLDRQGLVREMFQGLKPGDEAVLAEQVEKLLAEPAVPAPHGEERR
jgi:thiol-disulfide isomerase/thioredoxin